MIGFSSDSVPLVGALVVVALLIVMIVLSAIRRLVASR
jgi:hypothetical protein